eukprot:CAMPEP_0182601594 /NCGR_PEP_ID=MMETSP1324-20130603/91563_1 /TAXON_ID=236786 /ORGANISM="Florenciella sp., Strain RCC1587" /LENGTH=67 /DNA_ID=CAMNT_0024819505 /DNA_START=512 /DNA_END=716 /DNA_ORIENTATION=+
MTLVAGGAVSPPQVWVRVFITLKKEQLDYPCGVRRHENVENIATVLAFSTLDARERFGNEKEDWDTP